LLQRYFKKGSVEAGCDEAGRGCLAGPVVAAAVILPSHFSHPLLNDSKQLSAAQRESLVPVIREHAIAWATALCTPEEIDRINILKASILAMHRSLDKLTVRPESILVDGNKFIPYGDIPFHCMVKGDARFMSIAAASILAKTTRDSYMELLHRDYPTYNWMQNKGYPTKDHRRSIALHGSTIHHRKSFRLLDQQASLDL
jgi:ribonuclease HII